MKTLLVVFIIFTLKITTAYSPSERRAIVSMAKKQYIQHCILLVEQHYPKMLQDFRYFTQNNLMSAFMSGKDFERVFNEFIVIEKPTLVVLNSISVLINIYTHWMWEFQTSTKDWVTFLKDGTHEWRMSNFRWMIFISTLKDLNTASIPYIPYNCIFLILSQKNDTFSVEEIYNVHEKRVMSNIGYLTEKDDNYQLDMNFYRKRTNFHKIKFLAESIWLNPVQVYSDQDNWGKENLKILTWIGTKLNFTVTFRSFITDEKIKVMSIDEVYLQSMPCTGKMKSVEPYNCKNWIGPTENIRAYMYISDKFSHNYRISIFSHILPSDVCMSALIVLLLYGLFRILTENTCNTQYDLIKSSSPLQAHYQPYVRKKFINWAAIYFSLFKIIIFLILVKKLSILPFKDLPTFLQDGTYEAGSIKESYENTILELSVDSKIQKMIKNHFAKPVESKDSFVRNLRRLCYNNKYGFITFNNKQVMAERQNYNCKILRIPKPIMKIETGFVLRYRSPYIGIIGQMVRKLRSHGLFDKLKGEEDEKSADEHEKIILDIVDQWQFIFIQLLGIASSFLFLIFEMILMKSASTTKNKVK